MADERTELQSFHSAAEISFISLPCGCGCSFAQDRVPRPPKVKACLWGEAGRQEESPAVISLVVSRYQKNIQVWEKTYPGCRGVGSGDSRGAEDQHKFPTAGKGETGRAAAAPGGPRRIACAPAGQDSFYKFRFGASLTPISSKANPLPQLDRKRCWPPWTNPRPSRLRGTILRGSGRSRREG